MNEAMRILYLAIAAIAVGAVTLSGERSDGDHHQMPLLAALMGDRTEATPDKLLVGDPSEPQSLVSSR